MGHGVSKILDRPDLCDRVCTDTAAWLAVLLGMMNAIFPEPGNTTTAHTPEKGKSKKNMLLGNYCKDFVHMGPIENSHYTQSHRTVGLVAG